MDDIITTQHISEKLYGQLKDIEGITARLDRDSHSADTIREVEELNDYARQLRDRLTVAQAAQQGTPLFVTINCCVEVYDENDDELIEYHIVNAHVFELEGNDVTFTSPIGRALLFKQVGDKVEFKIPVGKIRYVIRAIKPDDDMHIEYEMKSIIAVHGESDE